MPQYARVNDLAFLHFVRDRRNRFVKGHGRIRQANQASLEWLTRRTVENLRASATRREHDTRNNPSLAQVLSNSSLSTVSSDGFKFLIHERVEAANARAAAYYRVIEGGPGSEKARYYWVVKTGFYHNQFRLLFFGPGGFGGQQARGSWTNPRFPIVRIRRPVPAYHYIERAVEEFISSDVYRRNIIDALWGVGLKVRARR